TGCYGPLRTSSPGESRHSLGEWHHARGGRHHIDLTLSRPTRQDPMQMRGAHQSVKTRRDINQNQPAPHPMSAMMDPDDHPQPGGVMNLGIDQMNQQVAASAVQ